MDPRVEAGLAALRDIQLPAPVGVFPPAPACWLLAAALALATALAVAAVRRRRRSLRRLALAELAAIERRFGARADRLELAGALATLLRRTALAAFEAERVAALHGEPWLEFLAAGARDGAGARGVAAELVQTALAGQRAASGRPEAWIAFARGFIEARA
jgi:selenocysteine lyase/cysteine desulfurase